MEITWLLHAQMRKSLTFKAFTIHEKNNSKISVLNRMDSINAIYFMLPLVIIPTIILISKSAGR